MIGSNLSALMTYPDSLDAWWIRLLPILFDIRPLLGPSVSTPYLDAQINFGLLITVGFLVFQAGRRLRSRQMGFTKEVSAGAGCVALAAIVYWGSTSTDVWRHVPTAFFQFTYRLVTYCDLFLLIGTVVWLSSMRRFHLTLQKPLSICLAVAVGMMAQGFS